MAAASSKFSLSLDYTLRHSSDLYRGASRVTNAAEVSTTFQRTSLIGAYRVSEGLIVVGTLPFVHAVRKEAGVADKTIDGLADVTLSALWSPWREDDSALRGLTILTGLILPVGRAKDQPLAGVAAPSVFQLGTGTFQLLLGGQYALSRGPWSYSTRCDVRIPLAESVEGFRPTETYFWSAAVGRSVTDSLSVRLGVEASHGNEDEFRGAKIGETGSTVVALKPALIWRFNTETSLSASVSVPVFHDVNETQIAVGALWSIGLTKSF